MGTRPAHGTLCILERHNRRILDIGLVRQPVEQYKGCNTKGIEPLGEADTSSLVGLFVITSARNNNHSLVSPLLKTRHIRIESWLFCAPYTVLCNRVIMLGSHRVWHLDALIEIDTAM